MHKNKGLIKKLALLFFLGVFFLHPFFAFAITYQPGETLDPNCLPTDPSCTVATTSAQLSQITTPSSTFTLTFSGGSCFVGPTCDATFNFLSGGSQSFSYPNISGQFVVGSNSSLGRVAYWNLFGGITDSDNLTFDGTTLGTDTLTLTNALGAAYGGTGTSTAPSFGNILVGNSSGGYTLTATSSLGLGGGGSGTVTSVDASGGTTGLSFSGGPITASGTLTLSGTLAVSSGGTGLSSITTNQLLIGGTGNTLTQIATSSLGLLTTNVAEGTNLYFTDARFDTRLSATTTLPSLTTLANLASIGTSATTVTIGNSTGAATTTILSGTGGINLQAGGAGITGNVQIGAFGASATPDLLLLDTKDTAGDPTGIQGAMYYNSNSHVFRCFEFVVWRDCETGPRTASITDTTSDTLTTTEAELIDGTAPSIDPRVAGNRIWITGFIRVSPTGGDTETNTFHVRRGSGDCTGTQINSDLVVTTSVTGISTVVQINVIDSPATTSVQVYTVCGLSSTATSPNTTPHIVLTVTEIAAAGADLAELYSTTDSSIGPGDVVAIDTQVEGGVLKTSGAADPLAIGIVSTMPGLLMNDGVEGNHLVQVSLAGRVPVKVVTENGAIERGDYLTSSSEPGVAMKSNGTGPVIGQAIGVYSGEGTGMVMAFVKNFDTGESAVLLGDSASSTDIVAVESEAAHDPIAILTQKIASGVHFLTDFVAARVTAIRGYFDELFAGKVHTEELCLMKEDGTEVCITGTQLQELTGAAALPAPTLFEVLPPAQEPEQEQEATPPEALESPTEEEAEEPPTEETSTDAPVDVPEEAPAAPTP